MPTLIDELIVRLGLDSKDIDNKASGVSKKLAEVEKSGHGAEQSIKGIGSASEDAASAFTLISGKLAAFLALLGGTAALKSFIQDTINTNTQLHFLSLNLDMSAQRLGAWGTVAEEFGGSAKGAQGVLANLSREAFNFVAYGQSSLIPFLARMNVLPDAAHPENMLKGIAEWGRANKDRIAEPILVNLLMGAGINDTGVINAILHGKESIKELLAQAQGFQATDKEAAAAAKLNKELVLLKQHYTKIGTDLLLRHSQVIDFLVNELDRFATWIQTHENDIVSFFQKTGTAFLTFVGYLTGDKKLDGARSNIENFTIAVNDLSDAFKTLFASAMNFYNSINKEEVMGALAGFAVGGFPGAVAGAAIGGFLGPQENGASAGDLPKIAAEAQKVGQALNVPPEVIYAQWSAETNRFKDFKGFNMAGIMYPGTQVLQHFGSLDEFGKAYIGVLNEKRYAGIKGTQNISDFAAILQHGGYAADKTSQQYAALMMASQNGYADVFKDQATASSLYKLMGQFSGPARGSVAQAGGARRSTINHNTFNIHANTADAKAIRKEIDKGFDWINASQANSSSQ